VYFKMGTQLAFKFRQLVIHLPDQSDRADDDDGVGLGDHLARLEMRRPQRALYSLGAGLNAALTSRSAQRRDHSGEGQSTALGWCRCLLQDAEHLDAREVLTEGFERCRIELPQRAPKLIGSTLPRPAQGLLRPCQNLHRFDQLGVSADRAMVMPVRADEIGEHLRIPGVRLGP
jgi:hypothetical protein